MDISPDGMFRLALITPFCAKYGYEEFYTFLLQNWTIVIGFVCFWVSYPFNHYEHAKTTVRQQSIQLYSTFL